MTLLSDNWYRLHTTTFDYLGADGAWSTQSRESYDRGNGATILLFNLEQRTVLLTSQFRYPAYINGHADGVLIETAAGLLDDDALAMVAGGRIADAKTIMLLKWAVLRGPFAPTNVQGAS